EVEYTVLPKIVSSSIGSSSYLRTGGLLVALLMLLDFFGEEGGEGHLF
ncbi:2002_t:CDS:1, partial [Funneliformis caledonium]